MDIDEECCIQSYFYSRAVSVAKAKQLKYRVIIHFNSSRQKIVVLTILEAPHSHDQVLVERGGGNIAGLNEGEAMEMLGLTNFEVKCCKILNDAEQPKIVSTK
jgi:hypothetical protein